MKQSRFNRTFCQDETMCRGIYNPGYVVNQFESAESNVVKKQQINLAKSKKQQPVDK